MASLLRPGAVVVVLLLLAGTVARAEAPSQVDVVTYLGVNGPAGGGFGLSARVVPKLSVDLTLGVAAIGPVAGGGARWNLSEGEATAFAELGFAHTFGGTVVLRGKTTHETVTTTPANLLPLTVGYHTGYHGRLGLTLRTGWNLRLGGGEVTQGSALTAALYRPGGFVASAELTVPLLPVADAGGSSGGWLPAGLDVVAPGVGQLWNAEPLKAAVLVGGLVLTSWGVSAVAERDRAHPENRIPLFAASPALMALGLLDALLYGSGIVDAYLSGGGA